MSSAEENKAQVRRFLEAQARGDLDVVKEMMAPDFVDHNPRGQEPDHREDYLRKIAEEQAAFSNIRYIIEDQITEGKKVMTRWTGRGIHDREEYSGLAPTGREAEVKIIDVHCVEGGKRSPRSGRGRVPSQTGNRSVSRKWSASANESGRSSGWRGASSKPPSPRKCPN